MERRTLLWVSGLLMAGIYFAEYFNYLLLPVLLGTGILFCGLIIGVLRGAVPWKLLILPVAFMAGTALWELETRRFPELDSYAGMMAEIEGTVYGLEGLGNSLRMSSPILRIGKETIPLQRDLRLRLKNEGEIPQGLNGRHILLRTFWQPAESAANPRGFDYEAYLQRSGYQTELRISPWQIVDQKSGGWHARAWLYDFRAWYGSALLKTVPLEAGSVAYGMAIGDTVLIPKDLMDSYRISGLGHILSVSGLHFAILYGWLQRMLQKVPLAEKWKTVIIISVLTFMGFLNGWTSPALRSWGMILLLILAKKRYRQYDGLTALSAIAIMTALVQPLAVLQPGFQFSYGSVLGLMTLTRPLEAFIPIQNQHLREYLAASLAVQGAIIPLGVFWFGFWNPLTLIVNFPVMILSEWLMPVLVVFPFMLLLGDAGSWLVGKVIGFLVWGMNACSNFMVDQAQDWILPSPDAGRVLAILLLLVVGARLLIPVTGGAAKRLRSNRAMLTAALILFGVHLSWAPDTRITLFSVGQGDGALVEFEDKTVLIDAGPASAKLDRLLLRNGISAVDTLIITHGHEDHIGGVIPVLKHLNVGRIVIGTEEPENPLYNAMVSEARMKGVPVQVVKQGDSLYATDKRTLTILYPFENRAQEDPNAHSLSLLFQEQDFGALFTGDLVKAGEQAMIQKGILPDVDFLKVPHHGSLTSSSQEFLDHTLPETAVISVGLNLYGLPNRVIMDAYRQSGVTLYRTDDHGAVRVTLSGNRKTLKTWR